MRSNVFGLVVAVLGLVGLVACGGPTGPGPTGPQGTVSASVIAADNGELLTAVAFQVCRDGTCTTPQATRDGDGTYSFVLPPGTGYDVVFARAGYLSATYRNVSVVTNRTTFLEQILLVNEALGGEAVASGQVVNALNGFGILGAALRVRAGLNTTTGDVISETTTDSSGFYAFTPLPAGYYTAEVAVEGFVTAYFTMIVLGGSLNDEQNFAVAPEGLSDQVSIVLTWGSTPDDLDAHLTGPNGAGGRFHLYWDDPYTALPDTTPHALLDRDDIERFGPETITLYQRINGTYRYSVHDFSNSEETSSRGLANSRATVRVYLGSVLLQTFHVPGRAGTLWTVFELDGTTITTVNTMSYQADETRVRSLAVKPVLER